MSDEQLHDDELVSAYLDGEATPAEIAEVEASDALLARVGELRAVRDAVAEPVVLLSVERRDEMIGAALGVADATDAARLEAKVVPLQRPQRLLLAMAAAVIVLAAVVGTGLIASRGSDEADTAAAPAAEAGVDSSAAMAAEPTDAAPAAEEEPMPEMDMETAEEAMAEEAPAEEAALAPATVAPATAATAEAQAEVADTEAEALADELARLAAEEAAAEAAQAETAEDAPAASTTTITPSAGADGDVDSPTEQVVDLGMLESLESLFEDIGASWSAALEDGAMTDSGACAAAVQEQALALSAETVRSFVATVGNEDPVTFDAGFARRDDGTAVIVYAASPDCEIGVHELSNP